MGDVNTLRVAPERWQKQQILEVSIPGEPVPKARARVTRKGTFTPARTRHHEMALEWHMRACVPAPARGDLLLDVDFFRSSKRRCDLDNLLKCVFDAANGIVWRDDSQVIALYAQKLVDRDKPRTELRVWRVGE